MTDALSTCYADIEPEPTRWLWPGRLPQCEVVLGAGEGGIGKGFWLADVAARVTRGEDFPGAPAPAPKPANVLLVTPEDHIRRAMAWRLRAAGADLERVFDMTQVLGHDFTIPDDLPLLMAEAKRIGNVRLVALDPISQMTDKNLTSVKFVRRQVWSPLRRMAEELETCVFGMHHLTKAGSVAGSAALVQAARLVLRFERRDELVAFYTDKVNIAAKGPELFYELIGDGPDMSVEYREPDIMPESKLPGGERLVLKLLEAAKGQVFEPRQVAAETGLTPGSTRVLMHRMAKKGLIERTERGRYKAA